MTYRLDNKVTTDWATFKGSSNAMFTRNEFQSRNAVVAPPRTINMPAITASFIEGEGEWFLHDHNWNGLPLVQSGVATGYYNHRQAYRRQFPITEYVGPETQEVGTSIWEGAVNAFNQVWAQHQYFYDTGLYESGTVWSAPKWKPVVFQFVGDYYNYWWDGRDQWAIYRIRSSERSLTTRSSVPIPPPTKLRVINIPVHRIGTMTPQSQAGAPPWPGPPVPVNGVTIRDLINAFYLATGSPTYVQWLMRDINNTRNEKRAWTLMSHEFVNPGFDEMHSSIMFRYEDVGGVVQSIWLHAEEALREIEPRLEITTTTQPDPYYGWLGNLTRTIESRFP